MKQRTFFRLLTIVGALAMVASQAIMKWGPSSDAVGVVVGVLLFGGFCLAFVGITFWR